jgi:hypothetical protein
MRKATIQISPSDALVALQQLHQCRSQLSTPLVSALDAELAQRAEALTQLARCLWWLEQRSLFCVDRAQRRAWREWKPDAIPPSLSMLEGSIQLDLTTLLPWIESGEEEAIVSSVALRSVLQATKLAQLLQSHEAKMGREIVSVARFVDKICRALLRSESLAQKTSATGPSQQEKPPKKSKRTARAKQTTQSFGGLPDDAEPTNHKAPTEPVSTRGLSLDAEFFLEQSELPWPSTKEQIDRARKKVLARLHPDRAGVDSTTQFHRAMRGIDALLRLLSKDGATTTVANKPPTHSWPPQAATRTRR